MYKFPVFFFMLTNEFLACIQHLNYYFFIGKILFLFSYMLYIEKVYQWMSVYVQQQIYAYSTTLSSVIGYFFTQVSNLVSEAC